MTNIALFASGNGSNADRIMSYFQDHDEIRVVLLLSNNPQAMALERARSYGVRVGSFSRNIFYETDQVLTLLKELQVSYIALAGFMWLVPSQIVEAFHHRILNIHPALLPKYGGKGMYGKNVHQAVHDHKESESGITIHYVNHHYDEGAIIHQRKCPLLPNDSPEDIAKKVLLLEHADYPKVIENIVKKSAKNS